MNVLDMALTYLAGAIDRASDDGIGWRQYFKNKLIEKNINLVVLDPTHKVGGLISEIKDEKEINQKLRSEKKWDSLRKSMKKIVRSDLRSIDLVDFLVVKIDSSIHMCGTYWETLIADWQHKPVLAIIEGGKEKAPMWLFGILDHNLMFNNEDECIDYLDKINKGLIELDDKWVLIRKELKEILFNSIENKIKSIEDGLLKTKDGVIIMPGMRVFWDSNDLKSFSEGYIVSSISIWEKEKDCDFNGTVNVIGKDGEFGAPDDFGLYSSAEALKFK